MIQNASEPWRNNVLFQLLLDNFLVITKEKIAMFILIPFYLSTSAPSQVLHRSKHPFSVLNILHLSHAGFENMMTNKHNIRCRLYSLHFSLWQLKDIVRSTTEPWFYLKGSNFVTAWIKSQYLYQARPLAYSDLCLALSIGCLPDHEITQGHKQQSVRIMAMDEGALQQWNLKDDKVCILDHSRTFFSLSFCDVN